MSSHSSSVLDLDIVISIDEARRYLGYGGRDPKPVVERRLRRLLAQAAEWIVPAGAYRIIDEVAARTVGLHDKTAVYAIAVCTIGPRLEREIARRSAGGRLLDSLLLDAIGSAAAEAAADELNRVVERVAAGRGLHPGRRVSPGYGDWSIERQRQVLDRLDCERLGITLSPGMMMHPRKSVSFAVGLYQDREAALGGGERCDGCDHDECLYGPVGEGSSHRHPGRRCDIDTHRRLPGISTRSES